MTINAYSTLKIEYPDGRRLASMVAEWTEPILIKG